MPASRHAQEPGVDMSAARSRVASDVFERWLALVATALLLIGLGLFWTTGFRDRISADAATTVLLAQHILDTGSLLPADWYYGNGDLWILGPQLTALPFVAVWGAKPLALLCGNAVGLAVIFAAAFVLARVACGRWPVAVLAASPVVAIYSHFQREFVAVQLSYGWMSAKAMLLLAAAIVWLRQGTRAWAYERAALIAFAVLLCVWVAENPVRPLMYVLLPLGIALVIRGVRRVRDPAAALGAASAAASLAGWIVHRWLLGRLLVVPGLEAFHFAPIDAWPQHLHILASGARHLYGGDALGEPPLPFVEVALEWMRAASLPLIAVLFVRSRVAGMSPDRWRRAPLDVGVLDLIVVSAVLIVGTLLVDAFGDRYLIPAWHIALVGMIVCASASAHWRSIAVAIAIAFVLGGVLNAIGIQSAHSASDRAGLPRPPPLDGVVATLRDRGYVRGFATHRYAGATVLRSDGQIEACDIAFAPELRPFRWLNAKSCFDRARYADGFFVLLAPDESDDAHRTILSESIGTPDIVADVDGYSIWMYAKGSANLDWLAR